MATLTRAIRMYHSVHGRSVAIRRGETSMEDVLRATVFTPKNFPTFLGLTTAVSALAGWQLMESVKRNVPGVKEALAGEHRL
jgi:hypothetical protein